MTLNNVNSRSWPAALIPARFDRPSRRIGCAVMLAAAAATSAMPARAVSLPQQVALSEIRVNQTTADDQQNPAVATAPDGRFVVVWQSNVAGRSVTDIYARRYAADGTPLGPEFVVNTFRAHRQVFPAVAINAAGEFIVAWDSDGQDSVALNAYAQRYNADGTPRGGEFRINNGAADIFTRISVALDDAGNAIFVWPERIAPVPVFASIRQASINLRIFDASNAVKVDQIKVEESVPTNLRLPTVGVDRRGDVVVMWQATEASVIPVEGFNGSGAGIFARRFTAAGIAKGATFQLDGEPAVRTAPGARLPFGGGAPTVESDRPNLAVGPGGDFVAVWQRTGVDGTSQGSFARRYGADGAAIGPEFRVGIGELPLRSPAVAYSPDGAFSIVAQGAGIVLQRYTAQGDPLGSEARLDQSAAPANALLPGIAIDARGRATIVWQDFNRDGSGRGIVSALLPAP